MQLICLQFKRSPAFYCRPMRPSRAPADPTGRSLTRWAYRRIRSVGRVSGSSRKVLSRRWFASRRLGLMPRARWLGRCAPDRVALLALGRGDRTGRFGSEAVRQRSERYLRGVERSCGRACVASTEGNAMYETSHDSVVSRVGVISIILASCGIICFVAAAFLTSFASGDLSPSAGPSVFVHEALFRRILAICIPAISIMGICAEFVAIGCGLQARKTLYGRIGFGVATCVVAVLIVLGLNWRYRM